MLLNSKTDCFKTFFYFCRLDSQSVDEKSNSGFLIFAFSFTIYGSVSSNLRKSREGSFASTYKLSAREDQKAPRYS